MGWVSYSEDIEELRQQHAHFRSGIDNIISEVGKSRSISAFKRTEKTLKELASRVVSDLERIRANALKTFEEAERRLTDPAVRIAKRLDKKDAEIAKLRGQLSDAQTILAKCRESQARLLKRCQTLTSERDLLKAEITAIRQTANRQVALRKDEAIWSNEVRNVRRLKR
jgi:chromosome segregation ATPase